MGGGAQMCRIHSTLQHLRFIDTLTGPAGHGKMVAQSVVRSPTSRAGE